MHEYTYPAWSAIENRIGTNYRFLGNAYSLAEYLRECSLHDFIDSVTVIYEAIIEQFRSKHYTSIRRDAQRWMEFCRDTLIEENLSFRIDENCVVHPFIDEEFSNATVRTLRGLTNPKLAAVRTEVEAAIAKLGGRSPDLKGAVRSIFEALEIFAKLAVEGNVVQRLNRKVIQDHLLPAIIAHLPNQPAIASAQHIGAALCDWVDAAHIYRHGQEVEEPAPPPIELAIAFISLGLGHLRWLLDSLPFDSQTAKG